MASVTSVVIHGPVASGKSTLFRRLRARFPNVSILELEYNVAGVTKEEHEEAWRTQDWKAMNKKVRDYYRKLFENGNAPDIAFVHHGEFRDIIPGWKFAQHVFLDSPPDESLRRLRARKEDEWFEIRSRVVPGSYAAWLKDYSATRTYVPAGSVVRIDTRKGADHVFMEVVDVVLRSGIADKARR